jgi:hypothetical protein
MNTRDLKNERKRFNEQYAIDYPPPDKKIEVQTRNDVMIVLWGMVAFAGAVISFPHTLGAIIPTLDLPEFWKFVVACAVFVGVEGALIGVAYSEMAKSLEAGKRPAPFTLLNVFRIVLFRIGFLKELPAPANEDAHNSNGMLLIILFASALLFNQADASKNEQLIALSKYVAGAIAPLLLLIAGHEFAHELASRVLAGKITNRQYEAKYEEWLGRRDDEWRKKSAILTQSEGNANPVPLSKTPNTVPNLSGEWEQGNPENITTMRNDWKPNALTNGNGGDGTKAFLMRSE